MSNVSQDLCYISESLCVAWELHVLPTLINLWLAQYVSINFYKCICYDVYRLRFKCMHEFQMRCLLDGLHLCFGKGDASYCTY